jgi:putative transposase
VGKSAPQLPDTWAQTTHQREVSDARKTVLRWVQRLQDDAGCTPRAAMLSFLTTATAHRLDGDTHAAVLLLARDSRGRKASNAHLNAAGLPTLRTLQGWLKRATEQSAEQNMAPALRQPDMIAQPWMVLAIDLKRRPQKPTTKQVFEQLQAAWPEWSLDWVRKDRSARLGALATPEQLKALTAHLVFPSIHQLNRFFGGKFSQLDLADGQYKGSALRAHKFYQHRTNAGLEPWVEVHADGWNTHFLAPCAITGNYISYEVWHFHDVATRYTTPFSIGVSESAEVIMKGLESCIRVGGVPAVWQTDSTGSVKNAKVEFDPVASLSARAGMTVVHPATVGNSQANGIAENYNTRLDRESRALATYMHPQRMDSLAFKQVKKFTTHMVKAQLKGDVDAHKVARDAAIRVGKGLLFESKDQMVKWLDDVRVKSNNEPHSALPKITCPTTGKLRHQTPQEALDSAIKNGWLPVALDECTLTELFMPHERRTVSRQMVHAFNKQYYHHEALSAYSQVPGKPKIEVMVAIDPMDGEYVWVKELSGALICKAKFVSATGYRSQSLYEFALERRMNAQIKRKENQIDDIAARMDPNRAPVEVQAIEVASAQVLDLGQCAAQAAYDKAVLTLAKHHAEAEELTLQKAKTEESSDFAVRYCSADTPEELAEKARQAQEETERLDMLTRMDAVMTQMLEEQRLAAM